MRRINHLFEEASSFERLRYSALKARRGNLHSAGAQAFFFHLENEILRLRDELLAGDYRPGPYRYFEIKDPKPRTIAVAPFRDRVVHHAVVAVLEPVFEKVFIRDSYACRPDKGTHRAVFRAQQFLKDNNWYLKADIEQFFASVNHDRLMAIIERKIKDSRLLDLVGKIIRNGSPGLPIGNLTSQFFANVYLDRLDHFVKDRLGIRYYLRYMDDFVVLGPDKDVLLRLRNQVAHFLAAELSLELKTTSTFVNQRINGLPFLGVRIFPSLIRLKRPAFVRGRRRLRLREHAWASGEIDDKEMLSVGNSYQGHWAQYDTLGLRRQENKAYGAKGR